MERREFLSLMGLTAAAEDPLRTHHKLELEPIVQLRHTDLAEDQYHKTNELIRRVNLVCGFWEETRKVAR